MILASRFRRLRRVSGLVARTMLTALTVISLLSLSESPPARADGLTVKVSSGTYYEGHYVGITIVTDPAAGPGATYDVAGALPAGVTWVADSDFIGGTLANGSHGDYPLTITVTSGANSGTASITLTIVECWPEIESIGNQWSPTGSAVTPVVFTVSDLDGDLPLGIGITGLPSGLGYVPATGSSTQTSTPVTISGTITAPAGNYPVTVTVTDTVGLSASRPFNWQVFDPVPVLSPIGDQSSAEGQTKSVDISATDNDAALTFSLVGNPPWITITGTGAKTARITAVTPTPGAATYTFTVFVKDSLDQPASEEIDWVVNNQPPVITPITDRSSAEGASVSLQVQADDPEDDPITYGATPGCLPGGLFIITTSGLISGPVGPQAAQNSYGSSTLGTYVVTVSATDGHSAPTTSTFTWTITDPTTPTLSPNNISDRTTAQGAAITPFTISGTDTDSPTPDSLTYSAGSLSTLPSGITLNETTGQIGGTPDVHSQGRYTVRLTCKDGRNTSAARTFAWTVTDTTTPSITSSLGNQSTNEGASVSLQVTATDGDADSLTFTATGLPAGLSMSTTSATTGLISGVVANNAAQTSSGSYHVTVTVTDGINPATRSFTWTVSDITTPAFTSSTVNTNQQINEGATPAGLVAYDNDSDPLTFSKTSGTLPEGLTLTSGGGWSGKASLRSAGTYTLTITVTDGIRSSSTTLSLKVIDTTKPAFTSAAANRTQSVSTGQPLQPLKATDADNDPLTFKVTSGSLPPGVALSDDGTFAGKVGPTANGQYRITISVSDGTESTTTTLVVNVTQTRLPMTIILVIGSSQPTVNGTPKTLDAPPFVTANGRTMVPIRFITEVMGAVVDYNNTTRKVTVRLDTSMVILTIDSTTAVVNAQNQTLDAPAQIRQSRTFVPIRFISEAFGLTVDYNNATRTITITRN